MTFLKDFFLAFLVVCFIRVFRGSLLVVCASLLISNTGAWRFFTSSFLAHDLSRTAHWTKNELQPKRVVVVVIDDEGYQGFFSAKSPLDRKQMTQLLKTVETSAPNAQRITLDLDLSPVPTQPVGQKLLDTYLLKDPKRWVLSAVNSGSEADVAAQKEWRTQLCEKGISFGLPYVPNEFGYPKLIHQYQDGLAEMSLLPAGRCAEPVGEFTQRVMPLSPTMLSTGLVVPFNGDLKALEEILRVIEPDWVVIGGGWGNTDVFATPFGDRFGVQVHAAALSGALEQQRVAPYWVQLLAAWIFVGVLSVLLSYTALVFGRWFKPVTDQMTGHRFFLRTVHPLLFVIATFGLLFLLSESLSIAHAYTGYWLPSGYIAGVGVGTVLFTWNLGRAPTIRYASYRVAWQDVVSTPIKQDFYSVVTAVKVLFFGPQPHHWGATEGHAPVGRGRALTEGIFSLGSLLVQVVLPFFVSLYFALRPL